jgi:transglutaminase/protease-like cytokinesis protein 3
MEGKVMKKLIRKLLVTVIFVFSISLMITDAAQAKPKFSKSTKTITIGKTYTLKIKGIKTKNIKKVTFKAGNKKVISVKKLSNKAVKVTARKKGQTIVKAVVRCRKKVNGKKKLILKCRIKVVNKKVGDKKESDKKNEENNDNNDIVDDTGNNGGNTGKAEYTVEKILEQDPERFQKINDYTIYEAGDEYAYGFITSPFWHAVDWATKTQYDEIIAEVKRIVEAVHISDDMTDQEKAWRLGRYLVKNIEYELSTHEQHIYGTLFNKKTVCAGYSKTFALLCRYVGIECDYMQTDEIGNHAWNLIKLRDYWYVVDLTDAYFYFCTSLGDYDKYYITIPFFREWEYVEKKQREHLDQLYLTEEYVSMHPIDTMSYTLRCRDSGIECFSGKQLYALPE